MCCASYKPCMAGRALEPAQPCLPRQALPHPGESAILPAYRLCTGGTGQHRSAHCKSDLAASGTERCQKRLRCKPSQPARHSAHRAARTDNLGVFKRNVGGLNQPCLSINPHILTQSVFRQQHSLYSIMGLYFHLI